MSCLSVNVKPHQDTPNQPQCAQEGSYTYQQGAMYGIKINVLGEVPLDGTDAQAPALLVLEELVERDGAKAVNIDFG